LLRDVVGMGQDDRYCKRGQCDFEGENGEVGREMGGGKEEEGQN